MDRCLGARETALHDVFAVVLDADADADRLATRARVVTFEMVFMAGWMMLGWMCKVKGVWTTL